MPFVSQKRGGNAEKIRLLSLLVLVSMSVPASLGWAAEDPKKQAELLEKIEKLERQINELTALKLQRQALPVKREQCMKAVGVESYCTCVVEKLPARVDYKQFVHILLTPAAELGYDKMATEQKQDVDATLVAWAKCVDYKGPQGSGIIETIMQRDTLF